MTLNDNDSRPGSFDRACTALLCNPVVGSAHPTRPRVSYSYLYAAQPIRNGLTSGLISAGGCYTVRMIMSDYPFRVDEAYSASQ